MKDQSPKSFSAVSLTVLILVALLLFSSSSPLLASSVFQNFLAQLRILGSNNLPSNSVFVDTEGNVGIGKTDPDTKLDVEGTITATKFIVNGEELGGSVWTVDGDNIYRDEGKVGIGTDAPDAMFHIKNNTEALLHIEAGPSGGTPDSGTRLLIEDNTTARLEFLVPGEGISSAIYFSDADENGIGQIQYTHTDDMLTLEADKSISFRTGNISNRVVIDSSGNVGIGTDNPSTELEVKGTITATKFKNTDGEELGGGVWTKEGEAYVLRSGDEDDVKMSIFDNGNVSIGEWGNVNPLLISQTQGTIGIIDSIDKLHLKIINNSTGSGNRKAGIVFQQRTGASSPRVAINSAIYTEKITTDTVRMNLDVHNQTALTIDNTGRVGIGTKWPQAKLHVNDGMYVLGGNGDVSGDGLLSSSDTGAIVNYINGNALTAEEYARADINGDGYVNKIDYKILNDILNKISGDEKSRPPLTVDERHAAKSEINSDTGSGGLKVDGNITLIGDNKSRNIQIASGGNNLNIRNPNVDKDINLDISSTRGKLLIRSHNGTSVVNNLLTVQADGKVGINTDNPQASLDIAGDLSISTSSAEVVRSTGLQQVGDDSVLWYGGKDSVGSLQIKTASTGAAGDRFTITSGGNVGIGKTNPTTKLDVNGDINTSGRYLVNGEETGLKNMILVENSVCKNKFRGVTLSAGLTLVASCPSSHPNLLSCTGTPGPPRASHGWNIIPDYSNNKCTLIVQSPRCASSWNQDTAQQRIKATCFK